MSDPLSKDGEMLDDAIHLRWWAPMENHTLCGQPSEGLNTQFMDAPWPDRWAGCWECMRLGSEQRRALSPIGVKGRPG